MTRGTGLQTPRRRKTPNADRLGWGERRKIRRIQAFIQRGGGRWGGPARAKATAEFKAEGKGFHGLEDPGPNADL
eukprot:4504653-Pyramimonas_sp.AAC.1